MNPDAGTDDAARSRQQLRDALSFLGHDAREGHSSTLALLELQRIKPDPMSMGELVERVERNARKSLAAIDDFLDLAHARTQALHAEETDLADVLVEVIADAWSLASRHGTRVYMNESHDPALVLVDRELLSGAIAKLLRDVVARAPRGAQVLCALHQAGEDWLVEIHDPSAVEAAEGTHQQAGKSSRADRADPGLAFLRVVAERHLGGLTAERQTDGSRVVKLALPRAAAASNSVEP